MTIKKLKKDKIIINLTGPKGNAFYLLGLASTLSKRLGLDEKEVIKEMKKSDYKNLIKVFDKYFGSLVDLYR